MRQNLPPLRLLTTFETVLRTGGVQNAAAELNVTQPAVSQALRNLEEFLGAKLLGFRLNHSQNATRVAKATAERKFLASLS